MDFSVEKKDYMDIFLNKKVPITVIRQANPPITMKLMIGLIWLTPVRPYLIPSTPYVSGSNMVIGANHEGSELIGNSAPESPKIGNTTKFMIS